MLCIRSAIGPSGPLMPFNVLTLWFKTIHVLNNVFDQCHCPHLSHANQLWLMHQVCNWFWSSWLSAIETKTILTLWSFDRWCYSILQRRHSSHGPASQTTCWHSHLNPSELPRVSAPRPVTPKYWNWSYWPSRDGSVMGKSQLPINRSRFITPPKLSLIISFSSVSLQFEWTRTNCGFQMLLTSWWLVLYTWGMLFTGYGSQSAAHQF